MKSVRSFTLCALVGLLTACSGNQFKIEGAITGAEDSLLYLEQMSLDGAVKLDSARLSSGGDFCFKGDKPEAPEFYRLRIAGQVINLSIDSTETVTVKAEYEKMSSGYTVEGSEECLKIRELSIGQQELTRKANAIYAIEGLGVEAALDSINKLVDAYKDEVKQKYIFAKPHSASAYYALFQAIGRSLLFDPSDRDDNKAFAAVATSWDSYYPGALRTENVHNIALEAMKNQRIIDSNNRGLELPADKVSSAGYIDIPLPDNNGTVRHISEFAGKVVLIDFHIFQTEESMGRIMALRDIYNKYHARGLEIYQVSLDPDEHYWKTSTARLPWVNVRDNDNLQSRFVSAYNIQALPDFFLIDREGNLVKRGEQVKNLDAEIAALL